MDCLRVAAISFILLHHSDDYGVQFLRVTPRMALVDVALTWSALSPLFAISGFLTFRSSISETTPGRVHLERRLGRLYVPFAIALVLFWLFNLAPVGLVAVAINFVLLGPLAWVCHPDPVVRGGAALLPPGVRVVDLHPAS